MNYLSEEEQYKKVLNQDEIQRIEDYELRQIRSKYWSLQHKAFLDERNIPDTEIERVSEEISKKEMKEIEEYKLRKSNNT